MRVAVTGATGFVGGRMVRALLAAGHEPVALGRRPDATFDPCVPYVRWDVTGGPLADPPTVDAVIHCAGTVSDWGPAETFRRVNVDGTRAVLATFPTARLVHVSTASVYDPFRPKRQLREDAPYAPRYLNEYAASKAQAEREVRAAAPHAAILRPHAIYGPGDRTLLPRLARSRRLGFLPAVGDGTNKLSVTHVDNLTHAALLALGRPDAGGPFNVTDAEPVTLDALLRTVLRRLSLPERIVYLPRRPAWPAGAALERLYTLARSPHPPLLTRYVVAQLADEYTLDLTRARETLGYAPRETYLTGPL